MSITILILPVDELESRPMDLLAAVKRLKRAQTEIADGVEESGYGDIREALDALLPPGFEARTLTVEGRQKPDLQIVHKTGSSIVGYVEVKTPSTLKDAFKVPKGADLHQVARYRQSGVPVLLSDAKRWFDVTVVDSLNRPIAVFDDTDNEAAARQLSDVLYRVCDRRPQYRSADASVVGITGVIAQINLAPQPVLSDGWATIRDGLGLRLDNRSLDGAGAGEVVAFSLLAIASNLPPLSDTAFVSDALAEWRHDWEHWDPASLPETLRETFVTFRDLTRQSGVVAESSWITIRAIASWINPSTGPTGRWDRLSSMWDAYLLRVGRRKQLGSWQTPKAVATYQAEVVANHLVSLGYANGFDDDQVTVLDPCCGTGVYLDSVVEVAVGNGGTGGSFNASGPESFPRLIGVDISSTAVAATYIRLSESGAKPMIYLTDTLSTGVGGTQMRLFSMPATKRNPIVEAARWDHDQVDAWATRSDDRTPVLAIMGNPPYERGVLDHDRYGSLGWREDIYEKWRRGSGGRGPLDDPYIAFWAWAMELCGQIHNDITFDKADKHPQGTMDDGRRESLFGVVSMITNRSWITGTTFAPMRNWVSTRASEIDIVDFGPGVRGGGADSWSEQPFAIQAGTAIVTLVFDPRRPPAKSISYQKAIWQADAGIKFVRKQPQLVKPSQFIAAKPRTKKGAPVLGDHPWVPTKRYRSLISGLNLTTGIVTGDDTQWIRTIANRDFASRHAYRAFDNRWSPTKPPPKAARGVTPKVGEAKPSAFWRRDTIFDSHPQRRNENGWYAILQRDAPAKPGPAVKATKCLPDFHLFKGSEAGWVYIVDGDSNVPTDYAHWANERGLDGPEFWLYTLAAGNHADFWTAGTQAADSLAQAAVEVSLTDDGSVVATMVELGRELVGLWSLDDVIPIAFKGTPGHWKFECHDKADSIIVNGRAALDAWRKARPGEWNKATAEEYAKSVAALLRVREIADEVAELLPS